MSMQKQFGQLVGTMIQNMPEMTTEQMQKWIGNPKGLQTILSGLVETAKASARWTKENDVIYFTVVSNGMTGEEWIKYLGDKGLPAGSYAQSVLRHKNFKPTKAGTIHKIAVLPGELFSDSDSDRLTKNIRGEAKKRKLTDPHAEVACLIRDNFTDEEIKEMGLTWIITMHEPIPDSDGDLCLLGANRLDHYWLLAYYDGPDDGWGRGGGFAFAVA